MQHIRQLVTSADADGVRHPGVHLVSEKEARALIAARAALPHTLAVKPSRETATTGPSENAATITGPPEHQGGQ